MIVAYKENNRFYFAYALSYANWQGFSLENLAYKENLPIKHERGFSIIGSSISLPFDILSANIKYLNGTLDPEDMLVDVNSIKNILDDYCQLDEDGKMRQSLIIARNDRAYRINEDFSHYEIADMDILADEKGMYSYFISYISMENGNTKERVIKAIKRLSKAQMGFESTVVIFNSVDDKIEII